MRTVVYLLLLGVLACLVALEQRALIGSAVGAWWLWTQVVNITLRNITERGHRERRLGGRQYSSVAGGARGSHRFGRRPLQAGRGRVVPEA